MRRSQWFVLGVGLLIIGYFLYYGPNELIYTGLILRGLGVIFVIIGFLEPKKKKSDKATNGKVK